LTDNNLDELLEKLDPKTRKRFKMAQESSIEMLPSASLELNDATGGGFPRGAITTVYGNYSSTKTAVVLQTIGRLQKRGLVCAFVDAESTYDKNWAARLGVDNEKLILIRKKSFGAIFDEVRPLLEVGIDFLVWDSISMTLPEVFIEDGELKGFDGQKQIGAAAKSAGIAINAMHYVNDRTAIVLISQTRTDMSGMHPMQKPTNGKAVEFGSSLMIKLTSSASEKQQIKRSIYIGDKIHSLPVGREVNIEVVKNKVGPPNRTGKYNFYYAGAEVGVDNIDELVSIGKRYGVLDGTNWIVFGDQKWNGQAKLVEALKEDVYLFEKIKSAIDDVKNGVVSDEQVGELQEAES
jgi:recombination protein RecA